jgi:hypothetical protein
VLLLEQRIESLTKTFERQRDRDLMLGRILELNLPGLGRGAKLLL